MKLFAIFCIAILSSVTGFSQDNLVTEGNQAMNEGRYRQAQEFYQAALARDPRNWYIYTKLGFCFHKQQQFRTADSLFRIVIENDSTNSSAYWYKGMNHVAQKQDSMAIASYKKFIKFEKPRGGSLVKAYMSIGRCYERILRKDGLYSWEIDDMLYNYEQVELADPSYPEVPLIRNFIELVKSKRPVTQTGKWKLES